MTSVDTTAVAPLDELALLRAVTRANTRSTASWAAAAWRRVPGARDRADRKVAIKVITSNLAPDDLVERSPGARTAASLSHRHHPDLRGAGRRGAALLRHEAGWTAGRSTPSCATRRRCPSRPCRPSSRRSAARWLRAPPRRGCTATSSAAHPGGRRGLVRGHRLRHRQGGESVGLTTSGMMVGTPSLHEPGAVPGPRTWARRPTSTPSASSRTAAHGKLPFPARR